MYQLSIIDSATNQKVYVEMPIEETGKLYISRKTAQNRFFTAEDFLNDKEKNIAFFKGAGYYNGKNNYEVFLFKKSKNDDTYYYVDSVDASGFQDLRGCTVKINGSKYFVFEEYFPFLQLSEDKSTLAYPFGFYFIEMPSNFTGNNQMLLSCKRLQNSVRGVMSIDRFDEKLIKHIQDIDGVDITPYIDFHKKHLSGFYITVSLLYKFIKHYSTISEYKQCVDLNFSEALTWCKYSVQTVKKKSAEALKSIDLSSSYPQYVQDLLQENINKQGLNIISLYKLGFKEEHFKLFKKIFKSYNKLSYDRFLTLYIFLSEYSDCNVLENIFSVLKNNIMSFDKSVAFFFSEFMRIIDNKLLLDNKVLKDTATYILNNEFFLKKTEIQGILLGQRKGKIIESFAQYPDVQEEYYGDKFNIKRINKILDCPAYVISCIDDLCASFYIDVLHNAIAPNQNELAFQFTLYNSDEDKFYVKVDTATQNILVFFADTNVNHKLFCRCLYNSKNSFPYYIQNHSKQDEFKFVVNEVQSFVYDKVFPKIIDNKISSLLSI